MWKKAISLVLSVGLYVTLFSGTAGASEKLQDYVDGSSTFVPIDYDVDLDSLVYYNEYLAEQGELPPVSGSVILQAKDAKSADDGEVKLTAEPEGKTSLVMEKERAYSWTFTMPAAGYASVYVEYIPVENNVSAITRDVRINGEVPFYESQTVQFDRQYQDVGEIKQAVGGDDIRPSTEELFKWSEIGLVDAGGLYEQPFQFRFNAGENTLQLDYGMGEMKITQIRIEAPQVLPTYEEYRASLPEEVKDAPAGTLLSWEAEKGAVRNDPSIRSVCDTDAATVPYCDGDYRLNTLGDSRWATGNQWAEWSFHVSKAGLYQISFRASQWYNDGRSSYRQVTIDNEVPFSELLAYEIPYSRSWQTITLGEEKDKPYLIYLDEGDHTIRFTTKIGYMSSVSNHLERASLRLSDVLRSIIKVTGYDIDVNYRYELEKKAPEVITGFQEILAEVKAMLEIMEAAGTKPSLYYSLVSTEELLEGVIQNPDDVTIRYDELSTLQTNFGTWMDSIRSNALGIDSWTICDPATAPPKATASFWGSLVSTVKIFVKSFSKDYSSISVGEGESDSRIRVWVSLGREWAEALRDMVDNQFTPAYGTQVEMNVFPSGQLNAGAANALMLAINSCTAPDVCIGVATSSLAEFAMRDVLTDLSRYEEFDAFTKKFIPNAFVPFTYQEGVYGIPCTQDFSVLFYRKDILSNLGLGIPQTWDDVYQMIAQLNASGYEFYYPQNPAPFIFQNGASYYSEDLRSSGMDDARFMKAFEQYTELFINYQVPTAANFFNRFRTGEMPIGVGSYDLYLSLSTAAPELKGRWGIYMLPGTVQEDGTIDRSVNGGANPVSTNPSTANMILKDSAHQSESWEFLQWFMNEDIQVEYGNLVESIIGLGARWNSANLAAFKRLPWSSEEIDTITKQWEYNKEIPIVPGSYATTRYLNFAWTDIVISGKEVRSTLEEAAEEVNREIDKKYKEFAKREASK